MLRNWSQSRWGGFGSATDLYTSIWWIRITSNSLEFVLSNVEGDFHENNDFILVDSIGILIPTDCFIEGCTDETANNFNRCERGRWVMHIRRLGCTDETANNFNPDANVDDGSCTYDVLGCTDETANTNPDANVDDVRAHTMFWAVLTKPRWTTIPKRTWMTAHVSRRLRVLNPFALNYNPKPTSMMGLASIPFWGAWIQTQAITTWRYNWWRFLRLRIGMSPDCIEPLIFVANVFTPNNDGVNDVWQAVTLSECFSEWLLLVFNRWGNIVWNQKTSMRCGLGKVVRHTLCLWRGVYLYNKSEGRDALPCRYRTHDFALIVKQSFWLNRGSSSTPRLLHFPLQVLVRTHLIWWNSCLFSWLR